jgi:Leucine-rich repeat (LRR) protein
MDKYIVYKNDLKYKKHRNLNKQKIYWDDNETENMDNINCDTLDYRINECVQKNNSILDLKYLELNKYPNITNINKEYLKYLFISGNELLHLPNLNELINLEVLDCSENKLCQLINLPKKLIELDCSRNELTNITAIINCNNLEKINCSYNEITEIPSHIKLLILACNNNKLKFVSNMDSLQKLYCSNNMIKIIQKLKNIKFIECYNNSLKKINKFELLEELYCYNNNIIEIKAMPLLTALECYDNNIKILPFMVKLKRVTCDYHKLEQIGEKYEIGNISINNGTYLFINFI